MPHKPGCPYLIQDPPSPPPGPLGIAPSYSALGFAFVPFDWFEMLWSWWILREPTAKSLRIPKDTPDEEIKPSVPAPGAEPSLPGPPTGKPPLFSDLLREAREARKEASKPFAQPRKLSIMAGWKQR